MKKIILAALLSGLVFTAMAQSAPPQPKEEPIYVKLLPSQLEGIKQLIGFSAKWLPTSQAPANDINTIVLPAMQQLYPLLKPNDAYKAPVDTTKTKSPNPALKPKKQK